MQIINNFLKTKKEKIIVFGTGSAAINFIKGIKKTHQIIAFMDNNLEKHGTILDGVAVLPPNDIQKYPGFTVIVASDFFDEIYAHLKQNKHFFNTNIIYFRSLNIREPFIKNLSLWISNKSKDLICNVPRFLVPILRKVLNTKSLNLVNIISLDEDHKHRTLILRAEQKNFSVGPNFIKGSQNKTEVIIPPVGLYQYNNCQISMRSRAFKISGNSIIIEKVHTISDEIAKYNSGHIIHHYQNKLAIVREEHKNSLHQGILINGYYDKNYYHWMIDIIPQLQYINELPIEYENFPIFITEMVIKIASIKELIELFNIDREIIYLGSASDYIVENLLIISSPNRCCPRIIGSAWSQPDYTYSRRESIKHLRELVLNKCDSSLDLLSKKIFLAPSMKHRKYNQEDVFKRLKPYGFVKINPEQMSLIEQAKIFNNAEFIIGPTGATWTNLVFAQHGAHALCWMAEEWGDSSVFSNLADIVGVKLDYLTYSAGVDDHIELFSKEYVINQEDIETWVKRFMVN